MAGDKTVALKKRAGTRLKPRHGRFFEAHPDLWRKLKVGKEIEVSEAELSDFNDPSVEVSPVKDRGRKKEEKPKKEGGELNDGSSSVAG